MSEMGEHERFSDDLGAYALGALDPPAARATEAHLADCERCREELRWLQPAVDSLPAAVEPLTPPAALRRRVMAQARSEARDASDEHVPRRSVLGRAPRLALGAALAAVALVAAGVTGYALRDETEEPTTIEARATGAGPLAQGELSRRGDSAVLSVSGLALPKGGDVYQAWIRRGERIEPSSVFVVARGGDGVVALPEGLTGADEVMVTREPRGGNTAPSGDPLLSFDL